MILVMQAVGGVDPKVGTLEVTERVPHNRGVEGLNPLGGRAQSWSARIGLVGVHYDATASGRKPFHLPSVEIDHRSQRR